MGLTLEPQNEDVNRKIADYILENYGIKTIIETNEICFYDNGVYKPDKHNHKFNQIYNEIAKNSKKIKYLKDGKVKEEPYYASTYKRKQVLEMIKSETYTSIKKFDTDPNRINVKNGHLVLRKNDNGELEWRFWEHFKYNENPYLSLIQLPVYYDPQAENLEIDHTISQIVGFEDVPFIYEIFAYCIMPTIKFGKEILLYGPTRTGKTTLLNILEQFLDRELISHKSPYNIDKRFQLVNTRGKFVNIFDDLTYGKINQKIVGILKRFATNVTMSGEMKGIQGDIEWRNRCKLILSGNETPEPPERLDDSFWNRWVLVPFYNIFEGTDKNVDLREKKWSKEEKSGLLNQLLEAWIRLEERGGFEEKWNETERVKELWLLDHNPVGGFVKENCIFGEEREVDYEEFYSELTRYRVERGGKEVSKALVTRSLKKIKDYIEKKRVNEKANPNSSGYKYVGLDFKESYKKDHKVGLDANDFYLDDIDQFE